MRDAAIAVIVERRRCVGLVLAAIGRLHLAGQVDAAHLLDAVALEMEHPQASGIQAQREAATR